MADESAEGHGRKPPARRVFLSHTKELGKWPKERSFVAAAKAAVAKAGDAVLEMEDFTARDATPEQLDREMLAKADIYVLIAGFRYGMPVRDRPEVSYTEQEFQTATETGMERLVFILSEDTEGPPALTRDLDYGREQEAFRQRLHDSGLTVTAVSSPAQLEIKLFQALTQLARPQQESMPATRIWNIPARTVTFTGRDELLTGLRAALCSGHPAVVQALNGMGGVGKTTTAIEYAHRHAEDYDVAWWVPSEDSSLVAGHLADLAHTLDVATEKDSTAGALALLSGALRSRGRWLVVFDNAEDPDALRPLLPAGGHVIITSRNPDWDDIGAALPVREFVRSESINLLRSRCDRLTAIDADRIADALGDLPLAVDQAARLLATTGWTAETYLDLHAKRTHELLARREKGSGYPVSVAAAWTVSFDQLGRENLAALNTLTLVAWLAPEPVPLALLTHQVGDAGAAARDPLAFADVTAALRSRGMAEVTTTTIQLHRVPAALLRARTRHDITAEDDEDSTWPAIAVRLLDAGLPDNPWNNPASWPRWQALLPHVLAVCDSERALAALRAQVVYLLDRAGVYLQARGNLRAALPLLERVYVLVKDVGNDDHPVALAAASNFAVNLRALGEHERARELNEDTLARRQRLFGEDHPETLRSASNLAVDLKVLGEYERARELDEDALARRQRLFGKDHPDTLISANNLAVDLRRLGEYERARELNEDTLARRQRLFGEDHPETLSSASNLAADLKALGEYERARELNEDTLARSQRVLGEDHPDTLGSAYNLASNLTNLDQHERARELDEDTLARRQRVLGEDHPDTLSSASNLAADLKALGEYERARELDEDTLARRQRLSGDDHPNTVS
ncbi:hypothetical protein H4696_003419 [Amycolatopsis lexingtonensis]|uniref:Tetratricopeptide repeat protein n=1 Tax=Amycolatopsis lexingtonensis TaxID=218822 RepID=A0ABR9HZF2_9PSEU|nr:FxSxx-COOH system tetratricopeptide repeat protein [Amycolatopsis lexingtonensis]MBE1496319.1 hypothetical protein [Amycolatopsis lexingtonensis]